MNSLANTKYFVGKTPIILTQNDFKAAGGEGSVYVKGNTAYKIYTDPSKMIPLGKIQELGVLTRPNIIKPTDPIFDQNGNPVGYTMTSVPDSYALCETFNKAFKQRENLSFDQTLHLIERLQESIEHVHNNGIIIVDLNEMNFLVQKDFKDVYFIDVDSYQTKSFPATAIMDSIRDRHAKGFNQDTDWFSFAIISYQMLCGIHPYKGRHPMLKTLDERMLKNVSVFNPDVAIPAAAYPYTIIPDAYQHWYKDVFEKGMRCAPPNLKGALIIVAPRINHVGGSNNFVVTEMYTLSGDIICFYHNIAVTNQAIFNNGKKLFNLSDNVKIGVLPHSRNPIAAKIKNSKLSMIDVMKSSLIDCDIQADDIMHIDGRLYIKQGERIVQITFTELPTKILVGQKVVGNVLPRATRLFDGLAYQKLVDADYISLFASAGTCNQIKIDELKEYRVIDAKYQSQVMIVIGEKNGKYDRLIFRFAPDFSKYDLRKTEDISANNINFTVLDNGVVISMLDTDEIEIFRNFLGANDVKIISDDALNSDCMITSYGQQAMFAKGDTLYKFNMK